MNDVRFLAQCARCGRTATTSVAMQHGTGEFDVAFCVEHYQELLQRAQPRAIRTLGEAPATSSDPR
jgi:hypothetical protein